MNLLQIKQKMFELAISDRCLAECCGVGVHYLRQCCNGSKPMTQKLEQKINGVFRNLEIKKAKEQRLATELPILAKEVVEDKVDSKSFPEPQIKEWNQESYERRRGRILGIKRARELVKEVITDEAFIRQELVQILYKLDDELDEVIRQLLEV